MGERALLFGYGLTFVALLTALGSGIVAVAGRRVPAAWAATPAVGLAASTALLTTIAPFVAMETAAWILVLPASAASAGVAVVVTRATVFPRGDAAALGALITAGLVLGIAPGLVRDTLGPVSLAVYDAWGYIATDSWLEEHTLADEPTPTEARSDLTQTYGHGAVDGHERFGVSTINPAAAELLRAEPDETHLAFLAALFALVPASVWLLIRGLGCGRLAATAGAAFGLSPAVFTLVVDSALANLAALLLAPPAAFLVLDAIRRHTLGPLVLAATLVAGIFAVYPEFVPPLAGVVAAGLLLAAAVAAVRRRRFEWFQWIGRGVAILVVATAAAPIGGWRTIEYFRFLQSHPDVLAGLPPRPMPLETVGAWAFGVLHVYQLPRFDLLSAPKTFVALAVPLALAALVGLGLRNRTLERVPFVLVPILVAAVLGVAAYERYQSGHCEYCRWKALTFLLPFLAAGIGLGVEEALALLRRWRFGAAAVVAAVLLAAAFVARADLELVEAERHSPAAVPSSLRDLVTGARGAVRGSRLLLEAPDAAVSPKWTVPETYYFARKLEPARIGFAPTGHSGLYLGIAAGVDPRRYYDPFYTHVLSPFPGMATGRRVLEREEGYVVASRAPVDVALVRTGWARDPAEGAQAIPWISGPFELWVSSPRRTRVTGELRLVTAGGRRVPLGISGPAGPLPVALAPAGTCFSLTAGRGLTRVSVTPRFAAPPPIVGRATETDPIPPPPKELGITGLRAYPGRCALAGAAPEIPVAHGAGWYQEEVVEETPVRWMRSRAVLLVGTRGVRRPPLRLTLEATSLFRPRRLTLTVAGRRATMRAQPNWRFTPLALSIPAGQGVVRVALATQPGAESATVVNPADPRSLAVAVRRLRVAPR